MKSTVAFVIVFSTMPLGGLASQPDNSKPKALIQEVKINDDIKKLLYPAIVAAKVNTVVTADLDGHVRKVYKTLGSRVKSGEIILFMANQDPAFTYSEVPVRSPISGVISQINFQLMAKIAKGEKLFTVMDAQSLKIEIELPASEVGRLQPGAKGSFRLNPKSEETFPIRVLGISPVIDPRSGTASAEAEFLPQVAGKDKINLPPVGTVGQVSFQLTT